MVVWVKIKLRSRFCDRAVETSAIPNSGFGHPHPGTPSRPIVRIPYRLARELCIGEDILNRYARKEIYDTAGGPVELRLLPESIYIELVEKGRPILSDALVDKNADVVLLSDRAISELGIVILDPAEGIWALKEDMKPRQSSEPEFW